MSAEEKSQCIEMIEFIIEKAPDEEVAKFFSTHIEEIKKLPDKLYRRGSSNPFIVKFFKVIDLMKEITALRQQYQYEAHPELIIKKQMLDKTVKEV